MLYGYVPKKGTKVHNMGNGHPSSMTGILHHGYINTYYQVDDYPLTRGTNGSLDPSTSTNI